MCTRACHRHKHAATEVAFFAASIKRTSELTANAGEGMRERFLPQEPYVLYIRSIVHVCVHIAERDVTNLMRHNETDLDVDLWLTCSARCSVRRTT